MPVSSQEIQERVARAAADNIVREHTGRVSRDCDLWVRSFREALAIERGQKKTAKRPRVTREHLTQTPFLVLVK